MSSTPILLRLSIEVDDGQYRTESPLIQQIKALEKLILCKNIFSLISHRICIEFASLDKVLQRSCVAFLCSL